MVLTVSEDLKIHLTKKVKYFVLPAGGSNVGSEVLVDLTAVCQEVLSICKLKVRLSWKRIVMQEADKSFFFFFCGVSVKALNALTTASYSKYHHQLTMDHCWFVFNLTCGDLQKLSFYNASQIETNPSLPGLAYWYQCRQDTCTSEISEPKMMSAGGVSLYSNREDFPTTASQQT